MISVVILINGYPIMARSAFRLSENKENEKNEYQLDTGEIIIHTPDNGSIPLCKKMLDSIHESKKR